MKTNTLPLSALVIALTAACGSEAGLDNADDDAKSADERQASDSNPKDEQGTADANGSDAAGDEGSENVRPGNEADADSTPSNATNQQGEPSADELGDPADQEPISAGAQGGAADATRSEGAMSEADPDTDPAGQASTDPDADPLTDPRLTDPQLADPPPTSSPPAAPPPAGSDALPTDLEPPQSDEGGQSGGDQRSPDCLEVSRETLGDLTQVPEGMSMSAADIIDELVVGWTASFIGYVHSNADPGWQVLGDGTVSIGNVSSTVELVRTELEFEPPPPDSESDAASSPSACAPYYEYPAQLTVQYENLLDEVVPITVRSAGYAVSDVFGEVLLQDLSGTATPEFDHNDYAQTRLEFRGSIKTGQALQSIQQEGYSSQLATVFYGYNPSLNCQTDCELYSAQRSNLLRMVLEQ